MGEKYQTKPTQIPVARFNDSKFSRKNNQKKKKNDVAETLTLADPNPR
jgi:hypothetical protein